MIDRRFYINVRDCMVKSLPRPTKKRKIDIPVISIDVGLWSPITW